MRIIFEKTFFCVFFLLLSTTIVSQVKKDTVATKKNFLQKLWGDELQSAITFMPYGFHTNVERHPEFFHDVWYVSGNYKSWEVSAFKNSFGDPTVAVFYNRAINLTKRFSFIYGAGLMYGYHGRLQNTPGIPFRNTFIIKGEINPVLGFALNYKVAKRWSLHSSFAPEIIIYGVRYTFKDGY